MKTQKEKNLSVQEGKGDIAYVSNDDYVKEEIQRWINDTGESEPPISVEDLWQPDFGDLIAGIAEEHHINKLVDTAFVGTEEYRSETEDNSIDAIECPRDERETGLDDYEEIDKEADMLDNMPLPGDPEFEKERKQK